MTIKLTLQSTYPLGEGVDMPVLGFGVYKSPTDVTVKSVTTALKTGYRHIVRASLLLILGTDLLTQVCVIVGLGPVLRKRRGVSVHVYTLQR